MTLESLANELLLDMFDYLPAVHILRAFHQLNVRFDTLIITHFQTHRFDFQFASKQDFELVCQTSLPLLTENFRSLGLSDHDETPQQVELFRSYGWNLNRFPHLRSLTFDHLRTSEVISDILLECPQLVHLNLTGCYFGSGQHTVLAVINSIWSLPRLISCYLNIDLKQGLSICTPTVCSMSIEHLSIIGVSYSVRQLVTLAEHTPRLRYLASDIFRLHDEQLHVAIPSITELNLTFVGPDHGILENLLQHLPNLRELKIETCYIDMDGHEWEEVIRNHLPNLKVFQLKMRCQVHGEKYRKELFTSFQTPFWLKEHQWFIRYHYNPDDKSNMVCLYTLPYSFAYLDVHLPVLTKSTCSTNEDNWSYDRVQHLAYRSSSVDGMHASDLLFPNVTALTVDLPTNDHLLSLVGKLDRLSSLEVTRKKGILTNTDAQTQLQALLDRAPQLSSLKFKSWQETTSPDQSPPLTPITLKHQPIRQLNLLGYDEWFTEDSCCQLTRASLGSQCEVLYIKVINRMSILYLISAMPKLRALIVRAQDDRWTTYSAASETQLEHWLEQNLPARCSIKRDSRYVHHVRIWIQH